MIESVLIFSRATPHHHIGGMESLAWNLAVELARHVPSVRLVTTEIPCRSGPFAADGVDVVPLAGTRPGRYSTAWWKRSRDYWTSLPVPPSIVLSVSAGAYSVVRARSRHRSTPFVLQAHGTAMMDIVSKLRSRNLRALATIPKNGAGLLRDLVRYREFDRIVAVGARVAEALVAPPQRWSVPTDRITLIPNGVRLATHQFDPGSRQSIRHELGVDDQAIVVGCVGRLHVQKRLDRALHAAAVLRNWGEGQRFRFLLVGGGPDEARLRALAHDLGLGEMVTFVGQVPPDRVASYYAAADVALLTTAWLEVGLPLTILEALACGLPCVVPTGYTLPGGPRNSCAPESVLYQVDPRDPARLAETLLTVPRPSDARPSLLPAELTLDHCARRYLELFAQLRRGYRVQ
jgi:Glycosyltransferase